jgi:low temperature requirement protein LtrA
MPLRRMYRPHLPRMSAERRERENVLPLELFFDLVMVLAFTQCTGLMLHDPSWAGLGEGILVLAVLWWAWVAFAWLTSVIDPEEGSVRIAIFAAMAALLVAALCVPEAFADRSLEFAIAYATLRLLHIVLYLIASRENPDLRHSVVGLAVSTSCSVGLILGASFLEPGPQAVLWIIALVIDMGMPAVFGVGGWTLMPRHFAERHNLVIILALGESIVALGVAAEVDLTVAVTTAVVLGVALAAALWWTYFDVVALVTARRLELAEEGAPRNRLARDSYSYLHFPMVAGIILAAFGLHETLAHVHDPLEVEGAFALLGGVAIYLLAHVALRMRNAHTWNVQRLVLALLLFALIPVATEVDALCALVGVNVLIWAMITYETASYDERRWRLRHGVEPGPDEPLGAERPA